MEILWEYKCIFGNLYWTHSNINSDSPSNKHTNSIALGATGLESEFIAVIWIVKNTLDEGLELDSRFGEENPSPTVEELYSKNPYYFCTVSTPPS